MQVSPPISLYIHLPWCEKQCPYCDFSITTQPVADDDVKLAHAIAQDLKQSAQMFADREFISVYFGGGTPSLASIEAIEIILSAVHECSLTDECEISMELNPNDLTAEKLEALKKLGINRFSLGVQSYHNEELEALGRNHNKGNAVIAAKMLEGTNSTIDLMYGIEKQTPKTLKSSLKLFLKSKANHLSLYQLTIEPNTIYYKKELHLPSESAIEEMEKIAHEVLTKNGFHQYEVSSWSKKNYQSKHNVNYWRFGDFLGVGPGSHSKITLQNTITRFRKIKPLHGYIKEQKSADLTNIVGDDLDLDLAMNLLRIKDGISQSNLHMDLPQSFQEKYAKGVTEGLLRTDKIGATKRGYQFLNETIKLFF